MKKRTKRTDVIYVPVDEGEPCGFCGRTDTPYKSYVLDLVLKQAWPEGVPVCYSHQVNVPMLRTPLRKLIVEKNKI